jgi:putative glycosyltransferase (TIGR04372 family)
MTQSSDSASFERRGPGRAAPEIFARLKTGARRRYLQAAYKWFSRRGYRLIQISNPERIGHFSTEVDALLKDFLLQGLDPGKLLLVGPPNRFANPHLLKYYRQQLKVRDRHPLHDYIREYGDPDGTILRTNPYAVAMYETAKAYEVYGKWGSRAPLFRLSTEDRRALEVYLRGAGVPDGAWYVCLHARGGGYSPLDEYMHRYRNADITSYALAVEEIARRGGWCIRLGDPTMPPHPKHERVIDYALSPQKTAQLDVALAAACHFFLGSPSGLFSLAEIFGRPCLLTNTAPLAAAYAFAPAGLTVPQRVKTADGRFLGLREIMANEVADLRLDEEFTSRGLTNVPNSADEIREAVIEMLDRLDGRIVYCDEDDCRQAAFRALFREGHYAWRAASSISRDFLRRYLD